MSYRVTGTLIESRQLWESPEFDDEILATRFAEKIKKIGVVEGKRICDVQVVDEARGTFRAGSNAYFKAGQAVAKNIRAAGKTGPSVHTVALKKNGEENKMHTAKSTHSSVDSAKQYHERIKAYNPNKKIAHNLYVDGKLHSKLGEEVEQDKIDEAKGKRISSDPVVKKFLNRYQKKTAKKLTKEDIDAVVESMSVEDLHEISAKLLRRYSDKAQKDIDKLSNKVSVKSFKAGQKTTEFKKNNADDSDVRKLNNRSRGHQKAISKFSKKYSKEDKAK